MKNEHSVYALNIFKVRLITPVDVVLRWHYLAWLVTPPPVPILFVFFFHWLLYFPCWQPQFEFLLSCETFFNKRPFYPYHFSITDVHFTFMSPDVLLHVSSVSCEVAITVWTFRGSFSDDTFDMGTYSQRL